MKTPRFATIQGDGRYAAEQMTRGSPELVTIIMERVETTIEKASETQSKVIEERLGKKRPRTLESIGIEVGLTKERIRQIQNKCERQIRKALGREIEIVADELSEKLNAIVEKNVLEERIDKMLPKRDNTARKLMRKALIDQMGFTLDNNMFVNEGTREDLDNMDAMARKLADTIGLLNEQELAAKVHNKTLLRMWPWALQRCGLHRLCGSLGRRNSARARTKAALIKIGRPATRKEIGEIAGIDKEKVAAHLSVTPKIVKADKDRWSLEEWIEDSYDGIVKEVIARIESDGGETSFENLVTDLPRKFGVRTRSVQAYMKTERFVTREGKIRLADKSSVRMRDLDKVIDGRDETGAPYWEFKVKDRHFEGYNITNVPPEFAKALGCGPENVGRLRIENLPDCPQASIRWRLASTSGAWIGCVREALKQLGVKPGEKTRITIRGHSLVEMRGVC